MENILKAILQQRASMGIDQTAFVKSEEKLSHTVFAGIRDLETIFGDGNGMFPTGKWANDALIDGVIKVTESPLTKGKFSVATPRESIGERRAIVEHLVANNVEVSQVGDQIRFTLSGPDLHNMRDFSSAQNEASRNYRAGAGLC